MAIVDRYSGWLCIYHFGSGNGTSISLINELRTLFTTYEAPEKFSLDGGPQFTLNIFQQFLIYWGVKHRLSSAEYPQSNGRAELGIKATKIILYDNISSSTGSITTTRLPEPSYSTETPLYQISTSALPRYYLTVNYEIIYPVTLVNTACINNESSLPNNMKNIYPKNKPPFWISTTNTHNHYHHYLLEIHHYPKPRSQIQSSVAKNWLYC